MDDSYAGDGSDDRDSITTSLDLLRHPRRRSIVRYLRRTASDVVDYGDLLEYLADRSAVSADGDLSTELHHVHLSRMDDAGVLEYQPGSDSIHVDHDALAMRLAEVRSMAAELHDAGVDSDG